MPRRLDHAGLAVPDPERAIALFRDTPNASVGPVFEDPILRVRLCFAECDGDWWSWSKRLRYRQLIMR